MMADMTDKHARLKRCLENLAPVKIALSGGVDSMTLALVAGRVLGRQAHMYHAISPAVPAAATQRVRAVAARENWQVSYIDAEEFQDEAYLSNPYNRCFYCKSHLYQHIAQYLGGTILSGTNSDDLSDFRPGLQAAQSYSVEHPFVRCGLDKNAVRQLCRDLGYADLAELPASPCLSSRVETGQRIESAALRFVDQIETELRQALQANVVRCRIRAREISLELDRESLAALSEADSLRWQQYIAAQAAAHGLPLQVSLHPYQMGSAFVQTLETASG
jgi:uncharacterized protein